MDQPTIIVTGASRGLGAAIAGLAVQFGARAVLNARSVDALEQEAQKIHLSGGQALVVAGDVSHEEDCRAIIESTLHEYGRIDALVNNGGVIEPIDPIAEADLQAWEKNLAVNLLGPVMLTQMALPALRQSHGRVINISSGAAVNVIPGWAAYSTAKAGLNYFTRLLAAEEPEITALAVRPGLVDTQMQATIRETGKGHMAESNYNRLASVYEQGRLLPPELPGRAIACLALSAPHAWSGDVLQWDEERVQALVRTCSHSH